CSVRAANAAHTLNAAAGCSSSTRIEARVEARVEALGGAAGETAATEATGVALTGGEAARHAGIGIAGERSPRSVAHIAEGGEAGPEVTGFAKHVAGTEACKVREPAGGCAEAAGEG